MFCTLHVTQRPNLFGVRVAIKTTGLRRSLLSHNMLNYGMDTCFSVTFWPHSCTQVSQEKRKERKHCRCEVMNLSGGQTCTHKPGNRPPLPFSELSSDVLWACRRWSSMYSISPPRLMKTRGRVLTDILQGPSRGLTPTGEAKQSRQKC